MCMLPDMPAVTVNLPGPSWTLTWMIWSREETVRSNLAVGVNSGEAVRLKAVTVHSAASTHL